MSDASEALGQRLKAERVRKGLSCQKAADELHLDGWVIEGLESGDYARIGPSVYAKGHLKRYAELLGLPVSELLDSFEAQPLPDSPAVQSPNLRMRTAPTPGSELPWLPIGVAALVALVVMGVLLWHPWRARVTGTAVPNAVEAEPVPSAAPVVSAAPLPSMVAPPAAPPAAPAVVAGAPATAGAMAAVSSVTAAAASDAAPGAAPGAASGRTRLRLLFVGDSWVDVRDAAGQRLFAGNGRANNVRSMSGMGPLRVYVKAASNVHLDINNHAVVIGPQFTVDNVAHFQAGADGVLRRDPRFTPSGTAPAARPRN